MLRHWLELYYTPNVGPARFKQLLHYFKDPHFALEAGREEWQKAGMPKSVIDARFNSHKKSGKGSENLLKKIEAAMAWERQSHHHIMVLSDEDYPPLLKEIHSAPPLLFIKGNRALLNMPQIAIVGSRKPTKEGEHNSYIFAKELAQAGFCITSGLALGVDKMAHQGAVDAQLKTIAVLGTGLEQIYPKKHLPLAREILENEGAIVSEFPLHMPAKPDNFPRRNRIIAGLSLGTLVVEAALRSGSLITARLAMEENREVFALPGSIHNIQSKGTHQLIREGATLVESTLDIRQELSGWIPSKEEQTSFDFQSPTQERAQVSKASLNQPPKVIPPADASLLPLFEALKNEHSIDQLVEILQLPASEISNQLMMLEIEGVIENLGGGRYQQKSFP